MKESSALGTDEGGRHSASFRDPAGFVYLDKGGRVLRQVNKEGAADFDKLHASGLYDSLVAEGLLVPHSRVAGKRDAAAHAVISPERIPFISYPFEWSFSQLQDAALTTLRIQKLAMRHGMVLKDASAYNIQFLDGRPVLIDTLSFESYAAGEPWKAYRQFCQHFLAPLALMAYTDLRLSQLLRVHLDGVPLDLATKLLPVRPRFRAGLGMHLFLHSRAQRAKAGQHQMPSKKMGKTQLAAIIDSLERTVQKLRPLADQTEWGDYYSNTNYTAAAADDKAKAIRKLVKPLNIKTALDAGGNDGTYSRVLNELGIHTVCSDIDPMAVEANYRQVRSGREELMLPVLIDFTNPGGALGWQNGERSPVHERYGTDLVMALALVHHLAISNNLPLGKIAEYFSRFAPYLLLEFVPKSDSQAQKLLSTREDIFPGYTEQGLKQAFQDRYSLLGESKIKSTKRTLYLFKRK